ncbi:hypothetical protein PM082_004071 [Marasmius tenuissimus]|nr:hypothetical protein PM082_004071 [Marasmius tenuissimus]
MISIRDHQSFIEKHLPDTQERLDREKEFCFYTWAPERSLLESGEGLVSQSFECGGQQWKLLFYPLGHHSLGFTVDQDAMSIYLARDLPEVKAGDQTSDSHFALVVSLHDEPEVYITTHGYHRFTEDDPNSGFTYFDAKKRLLQRQAVVSETPLQVSVFLRVFAETEAKSLVPKKKKSRVSGDVKPLSHPPAKRLPSVKDTTAFLERHMEDPYLDSKSSTLRIERWSEVSKDLIESDSFECGGHKWTIMVYPWGHRNLDDSLTDDTVSMYVKCVDAPKSGCCAQAIFVVSNIDDPLVNYVMKPSGVMCHVFRAGIGHGYPAAATRSELSAIKVEVAGMNKPLIEDDAVDITVFVRVLCAS